jgi:hypothetical protein
MPGFATATGLSSITFRIVLYDATPTVGPALADIR